MPMLGHPASPRCGMHSAPVCSPADNYSCDDSSSGSKVSSRNGTGGFRRLAGGSEEFGMDGLNILVPIVSFHQLVVESTIMRRGIRESTIGLVYPPPNLGLFLERQEYPSDFTYAATEISIELLFLANIATATIIPLDNSIEIQVTATLDHGELGQYLDPEGNLVDNEVP
ncbi:predicted protein [Histoplasma capsulatum H143]|uniref:Uncharacterized protein n=1 Tax=Ajellomyces capsulatus (strain H143) TaxID=544712 RepID=C6H353_AJECH|nr:predicted protein [Histoplasma capsulatum H143]